MTGRGLPYGSLAERRGLLRAFAAFGAFWGSWAAVLPDIRDRVGVDDGQLGLALACLALASLPVMPLSGRLVDRLGPRPVLRIALPAFGLAAVLPGLVTAPAALVVALAVMGGASGFLDVAVNTATAGWERLEGQRMMALGHGFFSLGVLAGAVATGLARTAGAGPFNVLLCLGLVISAVGAAQPAYRRSTNAHELEQASGGRRLGPLLWGLGAVVALSFLLEDAVQSWTALHLERDVGAAPWLSGLGVGLFGGLMAAGRLGAHVSQRSGRSQPATRDRDLVAGGGALLAVGVVLLALAPAAWLSLVGTALAGLGVSVLAPTLFSAVGERSAPGRQGADLSAVAGLGYAGFLSGPVLVGLLSGATTLPTALALLGLPAAALAVVGGLLLRPRVIPATSGGAAGRRDP
ncbi:MAG: major facilitator superfamily transporter [Frankiales bacterium]|nr:major facilitator superfamily transporter [Frankiales bacterium]